MYRGVGAQFTGCGPAHAFYFSAYEGTKHLLVDGRSGNLPMAHAAAGAVATVGHDGFMTPFDVVKQRMQLGPAAGQQQHLNLLQCMRSIQRIEGTGAFFASFRTTVCATLPRSDSAGGTRCASNLWLRVSVTDERTVPDVPIHDVRVREEPAEPCPNACRWWTGRSCL